MERRDPLTEEECQKLQVVYHQGTEARKLIIRELFDRHISYESCMARVDSYVHNAALEEKLLPVAKPSEVDYWDWLCRAAWHGNIWDGYYKNVIRGTIRDWIEMHCQVMGNPYGFELKGVDIENYMVPPPIPPLSASIGFATE